MTPEPSDEDRAKEIRDVAKALAARFCNEPRWPYDDPEMFDDRWDRVARLHVEAIRAARREERAACRHALCDGCREGVAEFAGDEERGPGHMHATGWWSPCDALAIRRSGDPA